jgi:predicted metal-binding membrane protein
VARLTVAARPSLLRVTPETSALVLVGLAGWAVVAWLAAGMGSMPGTMGLGLAAFVGVWALMMVAMMVPSVAPVATLYARSVVADRPRRLLAFAGGYVLVWAAAGLPAFALAWAVDRGVVGNSLATRAFVGGLFLTVALFELTPLKRTCLAHCRSPLSHLLQYASFSGRFRDVRVGAHHAAFCLGCCWALMLLLVGLGTMNLLVMVGLAAVVLLEKYHPRGVMLSRLTAAAAAALAVLTVASPQLLFGLPAS